MNQENKKLLKDLVFCLQLGLEVSGIFLVATFCGIKLDSYFKTSPVWLVGSLILAFGYIIKILLGAGKK